jgi:hypothetical protein
MGSLPSIARLVLPRPETFPIRPDASRLADPLRHQVSGRFSEQPRLSTCRDTRAAARCARHPLVAGALARHGAVSEAEAIASVATGTSRWLAAQLRDSEPAEVWRGEGRGSGSGSVGARLADFVGAVESGAGDDVSGHGVDRVGEGERVGQVELVVQGEELEDV